MLCFYITYFFFFKQKTAYEMRISDWSSDVCSSDLLEPDVVLVAAVVVDLVVAGAQGGVDDAHEAPHDAVLVEAGDAVEQPLESGARGGVLHVADRKSVV